MFPLVKLGMEPRGEGRYMEFDMQIMDNDGSVREVALAWNNNEHEAYLNPCKMETIFLSSATIHLPSKDSFR